MPATKNIIYNGEIFPADKPLLSHTNRAFCYGDAIFETMHATGTQIQFLSDHYMRLMQGIKILKMDIPENFSADLIARVISRLLNRDKLFGGVRLRLTIFRNESGLYTPGDNSASYIIESSTLENDKYILNDKGYITDIYPLDKKQLNSYSSIKTANSLLFVLAGIYKKENNLDDCYILNTDDYIIESCGSNIFIVKDGNLYTPAVEQGCVDGIMRRQIVHVASQAGLKVSENINLTEASLLEADEIFLSNAIAGIRWVVAFKQRRYYNKTSKFLINELNKFSFK